MSDMLNSMVAAARFEQTENNSDAALRDMIRAAIKVLREPTEAMLSVEVLVGYEGFDAGEDELRDVWQAMIDEALK